MGKNTSFLLISLFLIAKLTSAQTTIDGTLASKYERPSIMVCLLNFPENSDLNTIRETFENYRLDDKFNKHNLEGFSNIPSPFPRDYILNDRYKLIQKQLKKLGTPNKAIEKWFISDDKFTMDLVAQRGIYNATDYDLKVAEKTKRGIVTLKDAGERLVNKTYILVIDFFNLGAQNTYFKAGSCIGYLYKLKWDEQQATELYTKAWNSKPYLDQMKFDIEYITEAYVSNGAELKTTYYGAENFINQGIAFTLKEMEKFVPDFRIQTNIVDTKPLKARIGLKEGLTIDQKFMVYEPTLNRKGKLKYKFKGTVRAKKDIADNRDTLSGKGLLSNFYQDFGGRLHQGMLMTQRNETGLSFSAGWANKSLQGVQFRLEYNLSKLFKWSMFKIYTELQFASGNTKFGNGTKDFQLNSINFSIGLSKEYILYNGLHIEPYIGFVYDNTNYQLNREEVYYITFDTLRLRSNNIATGFEQYGFQIGARLPIHITHNIQLVPSIGYTSVSFPNSGLFGKSLPRNLPEAGKKIMGIDDSKADWQQNNNSNLTSNQLKWELSLRLKF